MKIYLAGVAPWRGGPDRLYDDAISKYRPYILESFYYADETTEKLLPYFGDFLLDSGAFTFMESARAASGIDWREYVDSYAEFITRNGIKKFFEIDIDVVAGFDAVLRLRERLESKVGRRSIPVWHRSRGKDEFVRMCREYDYVAIGGYVSLLRKDRQAASVYESYFPWFIKTAHENGAKIHGLGYTNLKGLKKYHFDSVDSTAWTTGNRFGYYWHFDAGRMRQTKAPEGTRLKDPRHAALNNYVEWIRFQKWAETHL